MGRYATAWKVSSGGAEEAVWVDEASEPVCCGVVVGEAAG